VGEPDLNGTFGLSFFGLAAPAAVRWGRKHANVTDCFYVYFVTKTASRPIEITVNWIFAAAALRR
jgi:hypothetical protein